MARSAHLFRPFFPSCFPSRLPAFPVLVIPLFPVLPFPIFSCFMHFHSHSYFISSFPNVTTCYRRFPLPLRLHSFLLIFFSFLVRPLSFFLLFSSIFLLYFVISFISSYPSVTTCSGRLPVPLRLPIFYSISFTSCFPLSLVLSSVSSPSLLPSFSILLWQRFIPLLIFLNFF